MQIITAPEPIHIKHPSIFLAGSIEQDTASRWQDALIKKLNHRNITILNPRRKFWDPDWEQSISNPNFREQVDWELKAMEKADMIFMYFDPETKSPITLLELGLFAKSKKLMVYCPNGYWRKGNVDFICEKYRIDQLENIDAFTTVISSYFP